MPSKERRETQRKSRVKMRKLAIDALGGACCQCGVDDYRVLEFDHVTPIQWRKDDLATISFETWCMLVRESWA